MGSPGWQDSTEPLCEIHQSNQQAFDVWADELGVYILLATSCEPRVLDTVPNCAGLRGISLQFNGGSGWESLYEFQTTETGLPNARLVGGLPGRAVGVQAVIDGNHGLYLFDRDGYTLSYPLVERPTGDPNRFMMFGVGPDLASGIVKADAFSSAQTLLEYSGGEWNAGAVLPDDEASALWADEEVAVAVGWWQLALEKRHDESKFSGSPDIFVGA